MQLLVPVRQSVKPVRGYVPGIREECEVTPERAAGGTLVEKDRRPRGNAITRTRKTRRKTGSTVRSFTISLRDIGVSTGTVEQDQEVAEAGAACR